MKKLISSILLPTMILFSNPVFARDYNVGDKMPDYNKGTITTDYCPYRNIHTHWNNGKPEWIVQFYKCSDKNPEQIYNCKTKDWMLINDKGEIAYIRPISLEENHCKE
ncbi:MAG: hypothetical protein OQK82_04845 [Candidatus Pacearchaeota archaeon]|nr:hypothetical protein [Candidatus Pacearchaeota archaeon]